MRLIFALLMTCALTSVSAQTDEDQIRDQIKKFSQHLVNGERDKVVASYTKDA